MAIKNIPFQNKLILNSFLLNYFGFSDFEEIKSSFSDPVYEGINSEGQTRFFQSFWSKMEENPNKRITKEDFSQYDQNIISHLTNINRNRKNKVTLKYFQYYSLLFVEAYLDNFFSKKELLLDLLNEEVKRKNNELGIKFSDYELVDLNKLAIWNATGSGKTLIMHLNFMQIKYYLRRYRIRFNGSFMLLTPSESLSNQHLEEFAESSLTAERYNKDSSKLFSAPDDIQIIENSKLGDKDGDKTVSVQRFGNTNILFVDEGHRGSSGENWYNYRSKLCENGFSFEYSATFSQAVSKKKDLEEEYAKCVLFDYSYKHFYSDGYGKDYKILNLPGVIEKNTQLKYLTASLLSFYQQKKLYISKSENFQDYNLENPLMVFVGGKVTANASASDKSDVISIIQFLYDFISRHSEIIPIIGQLLYGEGELLDAQGRDVFAGSYNYIQSLDISPDDVYDDILKLVFHANYRDQLLHADNLKGIDGEIRLRVGENEAFGVINVGSDADLLKLIAQEGVHTNTIDFSSSLFKTINSNSSTINVLIGSKKFSEGWNSWRVSTMGLMSVGKNEGSQIIQLFGRGVRLKGRLKDGNFSLKRSKAFHHDFRFEVKPPRDEMKLLSILETLNVFGLKADYMQQFKEYLTSEGLDPDNEPFDIFIPTVRANYPKERLKTLRVKGGLDFISNGPQPEFLQYISTPIILDTYGKVQFETSLDTDASISEKEIGILDKRHFFGMDFEQIYFDLLDYKRQKKYWNIVFTPEMVKEKLMQSTWYKLLIPKSELEVRTFSDFERFNRIGLSLIKKYLDKIFTVSRKNFEAPLLEYVDLADDDPNFIDEYQVTIENIENHEPVKLLLRNLLALVKNGILDSVTEVVNAQGVSWRNVKGSLFNPMFNISKANTDVKFVPASLVDSEWMFVDLLSHYIENNQAKFDGKELYLIRNASRKGVGFFDDEGFYPDFIMWYFDGDKEYIIFIEPHGMRHEDLEQSHKINFAKSIKELQESVDLTNGERPILESFIMSPTKYSDLDNPSKISKEELNRRHVLFLEDGMLTIQQIFDALKPGVEYGEEVYDKNVIDEDDLF